MAGGSRITVSRNFTLRVDRFVTPAAARELGLSLLVQIENRTLASCDEKQTGFAPYSARYAKEKGSSRVDLRRTGEMLADMDVLRADGRKIELGFRSAAMAQRARYHDSLEPRAKMPLRRFLGIPLSWFDAAWRKVRLNLPPLGMRRPV